MQLSSFGSLCAEVYDFYKADASQDAIDFYLTQYQKADGPVLHPMSGSGRFIIPFLLQGIDVDGVDASPSMVKACRERCEALDLRPNLYQQFIQKLELPRKYRYVFIPEGDLALISNKDEAVLALTNIFRHMISGGTLALDVQSPNSQHYVTNEWQGGWIERDDKSVIVISHLFQLKDNGRLLEAVSKYELFSDFRLVDTQFETWSERFYTETELSQVLMDVGFTNIKVTEAYSSNPPHDGKAMAFVCKRP